MTRLAKSQRCRPVRINANLGVIWATVDRLLDRFVVVLPLLAAAILVFVLLPFQTRGVRSLASENPPKPRFAISAYADNGGDHEGKPPPRMPPLSGASP